MNLPHIHVLLCREDARLEARVVKLQSLVRRTQQRRRYLIMHSKAIKLQAGFRGWQGRMQFLQAKGAAIWIQSCWRRCQAQCILRQHKVCLIVEAQCILHVYTSCMMLIDLSECSADLTTTLLERYAFWALMSLERDAVE